MVTENQEKKFVHLPKWEEYVLRKMYQLYDKAELCDVTLKFPDDNTVIQAHKVILKACSSFFDILPPSPNGFVVHMPKHMKSQHVQALINCMYTGKLDYVAGEQNMLCLIAKQLGMNYVIELLQKKATPSLHQKVDIRVPPKKYVPKQLPATPEPLEAPPVHQTSHPPTSPATPKSSPSAVLPGKKLPIWKQRTTVHLPEEFYHSVNKKAPQSVVPEDPKPTRFEWSEDDNMPEVCLSQNFSTDSFENLSYDSQVIVTPCHDPKPVIREDSIERMPTSTPTMLGKRARVSEVIRGRAEEDDDYDDGHFESIHDIDDDVDDEDSTTATNEVVKPVATPPKPILKTFSSPSPSKKVRFAVSSQAKTPIYSQALNDSQATPSSSSSSSSSSSTPLPSSSAVATPTIAASTPPSTPMGTLNHTKIINEILKKYPDLTKNKNIKLKIQAGPASALPTSTSSLDKDGKGQTKVQYLVLKSDLNNLKKELKDPPNGADNITGPWTCVPCADDNGPIQFESYYKYRRHLQEVHNERIDARMCEHCGYKASKRNLHLYHLYIKHNIAPPRNIHFPKCDQCNYIALSESLLIKHRSNHTGMVTKEYICRICNAAFKSHGALMGHMQTNLHQTDQAAKKDYECEYCGKIFNRNINLKAHIRTSHQEESIRKMYDDEDRTDDPPEVEVLPPVKSDSENQNVMEVIEVPVFDSVSGGNKTIYLPQGMTILTESPSVPLMPSSESEAMNNVATGIATSINITDRNMPNDVLVIDGGSAEIILRGAPTAYVMNPDGSYSLQEYIVPEIMADSGQVYTTALVSSAPATGITYVNSDNISIISSSDHTYADGMKMNGHVNSGTPVTIVSSVNATPHVQTVSQANQPIIMQEPIIVNADWVQTIASSQSHGMELSQTHKIIPQPLSQNVEILSSQPVRQNQKVEIISQSVSQKESKSLSQVNNQSQTETESPAKTAQTLVSDWAELDDDKDEDSQEGDNESEKKPSRPTIDLEVNSEIDM